MLSLLRADIARENAVKSFGDSMAEPMNLMDIRNAFIDADEIDDEDPELQRLIDEIPEDTDIDESTIDSLTESLIPGFEWEV